MLAVTTLQVARPSNPPHQFGNAYFNVWQALRHVRVARATHVFLHKDGTPALQCTAGAVAAAAVEAAALLSANAMFGVFGTLDAPSVAV